VLSTGKISDSPIIEKSFRIHHLQKFLNLKRKLIIRFATFLGDFSGVTTAGKYLRSKGQNGFLLKIDISAKNVDLNIDIAHIEQAIKGVGSVCL